LVLAACSPYFNAMFTNQHKESSSSKVELNGVEGEALGALIEFAYTSSLVICQETVQAIMAAANLLQITDVVGACCNFLLDQIDVENCLGIAAFAEMLSCEKLQVASWQFTLENFQDVCLMEEFLDTPTFLLKRLLKSESLTVSSEEDVLDCVMRWYTHNPLERATPLCQILRYVKLPLISWAVLDKRLMSDPLLTAEEDFHVLISRARQLQSCSKRSEELEDIDAQCIPRKSVGQSSSLYVVGGETTPGRSMVRTMECYNPTKNSWTVLAPMSTCRRGIGIVIVKGLLYVMGGSSGQQALR